MDEGEEERGGWLLHTPPPRRAPSSFPQVPWLTVLVWQRGREHLAGCSPWWPAGFRCIFPGSPDEWSLIAVGEGFASAAQCTRLTPLGRPCEEGLKECWLPVTQPYSQRKCTAADSLTAGECVYKGTEGVRSHSVSGGMWDRLRRSIHFWFSLAAFTQQQQITVLVQSDKYGYVHMHFLVKWIWCQLI